MPQAPTNLRSQKEEEVEVGGDEEVLCTILLEERIKGLS